MTVNARRVASVPRRTTVETWLQVLNLVAPPGTEAWAELDRIAGVASALIAEEYTRDAPIVVSGEGPQFRIYTVHGALALEVSLEDELPLNELPARGAWALSLPCGIEDLDEMTEAIGNAPHVVVRRLDDKYDTSPAQSAVSQRPVINVAALEQS